MAFTGILTTDAECDSMAGENVDVTGWTEPTINAWIAQAEGYLCLIGKYNFVAHVATLNTEMKAVLSEYCVRYTANQGITYNMNGYSSRIEAEDMVNIHIYRMEKIEKLISDPNFVKLISTA